MAAHSNKSSSPGYFYFVCVFIILCISLTTVSALANSDEYFVDGNDGQDTNDGSQANPWRTLSQARKLAPAGSTVIVADGSYNLFSVRTHRPELDDYITFKAAEGVAPSIRGISIEYTEIQNVFFRFDGFNIVGPAGSRIVSLKNVKKVEILNSEIRGEKWARSGLGTTGIYVSGSEDIIVSGTHFYEVHTGLVIGGSAGTVIRRNLIEPKAGSGIRYVGGNKSGLIENNHIRGDLYVPYPDDPDSVQKPHASIISVRSSGLSVKGNLLHGMGNSSAIMFYLPDASGGETAYSNINIENNAIFDIHNYYAIRIYNLGEDVRIVNNLIFSMIREGDCEGFTKDARYRYNTALAVHSLGTGFDGSGLHLYNNVLVGALMAPATIQESNNVIWSWLSEGGWLANPPHSNSLIIESAYGGCGRYSPFFENGSFFESRVDFSNLSDLVIPNFYLASDSIGNNFGDPEKQAQVSLGAVGSDGFLRENGVIRNFSIHSAGPYENFLRSRPNPPVLSVE